MFNILQQVRIIYKILEGESGEAAVINKKTFFISMEQIICLFGDSITWGAWDPEKGGWSTRLRSYFETNNYEVELYNCGISGDTTDGLLKRFDVECAAREPQVIVFAIGINDSLYINSKDNPRTPLDKFQNNINVLLEKAKKYTDKVVCLGLTKVDDSKTAPCPWKPTKFYTDENVKKYDAKIKEVCQDAEVLFLKIHDLLENSDLEDGLHPNSQGHEKMFLRVKDFLLSNKVVQ